MENATIYGAALLLALLIASPALDYFNFKPFGDWKPKRGPWIWDLVRSELGAVTVTYYARGSGVLVLASTVAPTATQSSVLQRVAATVAFGATADVQALITHNLGLDVSAPNYFDPALSWELQVAQTNAPLITFDRTNTNVLKVNKTATEGPVTLLVSIRRGIGTVGQ